MSKGTWKFKLATVLISVFMTFAALLLGEVYCRLFTRINFLDNSRQLFTPNRFGRSWGNTPGLEGVSFGETFHIDTDGFRTDPRSVSRAAPDAPAILVLGDSVAFGSGVRDDETITVRLRTLMPDRRIYDASSIGYYTFDYKNVVEALIRQKPSIKTVVLFFCLNDINDISAMQIKLQANSAEIPDPEPDKKSFAHRVNQFLRTRSKLYLLLKNTLQDTQLIHLKTDAAFYRDDENVKFCMQPLADIKETLDKAGVDLQVFLLPYEAQLRPGVPEDLMTPQQKVGKFLEANDIDYYDTTTDFKNAGPPEPLYLFGDPMHFSPEGHRIAADIACRSIAECGLRTF